jgi:Uma2 family endonuclease
MIASPPQPKPLSQVVPPLENGDLLTQGDFLRRYEAMTGLKKAELIEGIVHMPSPVSTKHAEPDGLIQGWLSVYAAHHNLKHYTNVTLLLDADNAPQPDAALCTPPQEGGRVWLNETGYLCGAPELVVEIAASTVSIDLRDKMRAYRRNGVAEYLVWRVQDQALDWFVLEDGQYLPMVAADDTLLESRVFPGLRLNVTAALAGHRSAVLAALG